jgi:hypothetical protein
VSVNYQGGWRLGLVGASAQLRVDRIRQWRVKLRLKVKWLVQHGLGGLAN